MDASITNPTVTTPPSNKQPDKTSLKDLIEIAGKIFIFLAGLCYIMGLFAVNIHFRQYGFYSLSLLQLNYIIAGVWVLIPIMLPILCAALILFQIYSKRKTRDLDKFRNLKKLSWGEKISSILVLLTVGSGGVMIFYFITTTIAKSLNIYTGQVWLSVGFSGAVAGYAIGITIYYLWLYPIRLRKYYLKHAFSNRHFIPTKIFIQHIIRIFAALLVFVWYISVFGNDLYKEIPASLGGGSLRQIRLIIAEEDKSYLEVAGLSFEENSVKSIPVDLIIITEKDYVLKSKSTDLIFTVPSDSVKAIIYEKEVIHSN